MAHEIDVTTGEAAVFTVGVPPWHNLGTVVKEAQTSAHAIELAGLDWHVARWNLQAVNEAGEIQAVEKRFANVRLDTGAVLGVVSDSYSLFQNVEAFDFFDALVGEKLAMYETAGSLFGGRRIWVLARVPREFQVVDNDSIESYVLLTNSHDGSWALRMIPTTVRVVCANTLNLALGRTKSEGVTIRHRGNLMDRVTEAREALGLINRRLDEFNREVELLVSKKLTQEHVRQYFESLIPEGASDRVVERSVSAWTENFSNSRQTINGIEDSAWAAFNAVSEWSDHSRGFRGEGVVKEERRMDSNIFGTSNRLKQKAFVKALELSV